MTKIDTTQAEVNEIIRNMRTVEVPAFTISASHWQSLAGVHEPWIMEISGTQYSRMSNRGKAQYDHKRHVEWSASAAAKGEWRRLVMRAFDEGETDLEDPRLHRDAADAIKSTLRQRTADAAAQRLQSAHQSNNFRSASELHVGMRVWDFIAHKYVIVTKLFAKSARIKREDGLPFYGTKYEGTVAIGQLQRLSYDDMKASVQ